MPKVLIKNNFSIQNLRPEPKKIVKSIQSLYVSYITVHWIHLLNIIFSMEKQLIFF